MNLTPKQERFCQEYVKNSSNASACYRLAYNCSNMKDSTVNENASRLLKDSKVVARIEELRKPLMEKFNYTMEDSFRKIVEIQNKAFEDLDYKSSLRAEELKGKLLGLYDDKNKNSNGGTTLINEQNNSQVNIVFTSKPQEVSNGE